MTMASAIDREGRAGATPKKCEPGGTKHAWGTKHDQEDAQDRV